MKKIVVLAAISITMAACRGKTINPWDDYFIGNIEFINESPEAKGSEIYSAIIPNPNEYITAQARKVLETLYFSPDDSIPGIKDITYVLKDYKGVSAKGGEPPHINIVYSTQWIEKSFGDGDTAKVDYETRGVLYHELTHGYQLEPKGGNYADGYCTTGFFFAWLVQTKDKNFLRKLNRSALEVIPWSFNGAIKHVLGEQYNIDELWKEYMVAMGDE